MTEAIVRRATLWLDSNLDRPYGTEEEEHLLDVQHHNEAYDLVRDLLTDRLSHQQRADEAERTVASLAAMLGWGNVPPRETLESDIRALKARATNPPNDPAYWRRRAEAAQADLARLKGEVAAIDAVLDRRDALANINGSVEKILHMIRLAREADPRGLVAKLESENTELRADLARLRAQLKAD